MLAANSPFLNIPATLDRKQAVFLDGMRHASQIVDFSYTRLCQALTDLSASGTTAEKFGGFTHIFLDAWAFIDAADRFRCLWEMQPTASTIPEKFSPKIVRLQLQDVHNLRNVSAHISQKIDQIVSLNSSVLGAISWVSLLSQNPIRVKTNFIRPGVAVGNVKCQLAMPKSAVTFNHGSGHISVAAGKHSANLSLAHKNICAIIEFAEASLNTAFLNSPLEHRLPADIFGSAELDIPTPSCGA